MRGEQLTIEYLSARLGAMLSSHPAKNYANAAPTTQRRTASVGVVCVELEVGQ